jgi:hypothetical protein
LFGIIEKFDDAFLPQAFILAMRGAKVGVGEKKVRGHWRSHNLLSDHLMQALPHQVFSIIYGNAPSNASFPFLICFFAVGMVY